MTAPEPPDWRSRAWAWARHAVARPITSGAKRAALTLFVITLALFGANLLFTAREVAAVRGVAATVTQLCQAGNQASIKQVVLWEHLVTIAQPPPHETPAAERKRLATARAFIGYVQRVFAPRDCQAPLTTRRH